ncbi:hypothetical protein ACFY4C_03290 [Actinomadura viridis]|uniref:hypothetical protein n=1 Tax=Actinomadura viridis TaxID=58110 RepID=UPI0036ABFDB2
MEADNIEAVHTRAPTAVLKHLKLGLTPHTAVTGMIGDAMLAAEGGIHCLTTKTDATGARVGPPPHPDNFRIAPFEGMSAWSA